MQHRRPRRPSIATRLLRRGIDALTPFTRATPGAALAAPPRCSPAATDVEDAYTRLPDPALAAVRLRHAPHWDIRLAGRPTAYTGRHRATGTTVTSVDLARLDQALTRLTADQTRPAPVEDGGQDTTVALVRPYLIHAERAAIHRHLGRPGPRADGPERRGTAGGGPREPAMVR